MCAALVLLRAATMNHVPFPSAKEFADKTEAAIQAQRGVAEKEALEQLGRLFPFIEAASADGRWYVDVELPLSVRARELLRDLKYEVRDDGEGVATSWHICWGRA